MTVNGSLHEIRQPFSVTVHGKTGQVWVATVRSINVKINDPDTYRRKKKSSNLERSYSRTINFR